MDTKNYILKLVTYYDKGKKTIFNNHISGEKVKNKEDFFSEESYVDRIHENKIEFDYLIPISIGNKIKITHICDFHDWLRESPSNMYSYVVSKRFKEVLNDFNLYPNQFYDAKVLFDFEFYPYFVWQLFRKGFNEFINFKHTLFCEYEFQEEKKIGTETVKVSNLKEIRKLRRTKEWEDWGFDRLVMKPCFKEMDCVWINRLGVVISERLKNAIEAMQPEITGLEIKPCPVEFEYL